MRNKAAGFTILSSRADVAYETGISQAKAVIAALQAAVSAGQIGQMRRELPAAYDRLFDD